MKTLAVLKVDEHVMKSCVEGVSMFYRLKAAVCVALGRHTEVALHEGKLVALTFDIQKQVGNQLHVAGIRVPRGLRHWVYESYWVPAVVR